MTTLHGNTLLTQIILLLERGDNKITARLLCSDDNEQVMRKWDSVTVVGQAGAENSYHSPTEKTFSYTNRY
jgi:hypothetical protein